MSDCAVVSRAAERKFIAESATMVSESNAEIRLSMRVLVESGSGVLVMRLS